MFPFTDIETSLLGNLISEFRKRRQEILSKNRMGEISLADTDLKKEFSLTQIKLINQTFDFLTEVVIPKFDKGESPGIFALRKLGKQAEKLFKDTEYLSANPDYNLLGNIYGNLESLLSSQKFDEQHISHLKEILKKNIKASTHNFLTHWQKIPDFSLEHSLKQIDSAIDSFDFSAYFVKGQLDVGLLKENGSFYWHLHNALGIKGSYQIRIYDPVVFELFNEISIMLAKFPLVLDELVSFLNPEAFALLIVSHTPRSEAENKEENKGQFSYAAMGQTIHANDKYLKYLGLGKDVINSALNTYKSAHEKKLKQLNTIKEAHELLGRIALSITELNEYKIPQLQQSTPSAESIEIYEREIVLLAEHQKILANAKYLLNQSKSTLDEDPAYSELHMEMRQCEDRIKEQESIVCKNSSELLKLLEKAKLKKLADERLANASVDDLIAIFEENKKKIEAASSEKNQTERSISKLRDEVAGLSVQYYQLMNRLGQKVYPSILVNSQPQQSEVVKVNFQNVSDANRKFEQWKGALSKQVNEREEIIKYKETLIAAVMQCLNNSGKGDFPLSAINKLNVLNVKGAKLSGLDYFLSVIGDKTFEVNRLGFVSTNYQVEKKEQLYALIGSKELEYAKVRAEQLKISALIEEGDKEIQTLNAVNQSLNASGEEDRRLTLTLDGQKKQLDDLELEQRPLSSVIGFFNAAKSLVEKMNGLMALNGFQENGVSLYFEDVISLFEKMDEFKKTISPQSPYHRNLQSIEALKDAADQQVETYFKLELSEQSDLLAPLLGELGKIEAVISGHLNLDELNEQLKQFNDLKSTLNGCTGRISFIAKHKPILAEQALADLKNLTEQFEPVSLRLNEIADALLASMHKQLTAQTKEDLYRLDFDANDEVIENYRNKQHVLDLHKTNLFQFSPDSLQVFQDQFKQLNPELIDAHEQIERFQQHQQAIVPVFASKMAVADTIRERLILRSKIFADFDLELQEYLSKRNQRHHTKDFFNSADQSSRTLFIECLEKQLAQFKATGDSQSLLDLINTRGKAYSGVHFKPLLNRLTLAVKEYRKQVPATYEKPFVFIPRVLADRDALLGRIRAVNADAAEKIDVLYSSINAMEAYSEKLAIDDKAKAETASTLACQLKQRVDEFLMDNESVLTDSGKVDEQTYRAFEDDFRLHLHSQDDAMSERRNTWQPLLGNIFVSVISAGLALIAKLAYSKIKDGYASAFFTNTSRMGFVENIERSVKSMATTASCA
ncbi:hypothetical protein [Legionella quinlivanii]|uniref:hypothetical protein n=1 Tax=Legionella quinlivanii TaxID=45073 RepID=UPI002244EFB2|nr:hypothetical protein [Legionella quinlivanii]MCW8451008.1 hypothetical protein [Legionella quinlivanii]